MNNKFQMGDKVTSLGWCRGIIGVVEDFVKGHGESYTYKVHVSTWNKCPYDTVFALPESDLQIIPSAFKFEIGDIVLWRNHPDFEPGKIIHRCTGAIDGVNIYTLRNWEGKVTRFSEFNLELATKAKDFPDYKFEIGDTVTYAHFITGEKRLYEVVGRHRGVIHNRYTLIGAHDHSKNPGTFVKQESLLKLYAPKYTWVDNYKTPDAVDCTRCAYKQAMNNFFLNGNFHSTAGVDVRWLKFTGERRYQLGDKVQFVDSGNDFIVCEIIGKSDKNEVFILLPLTVNKQVVGNKWLRYKKKLGDFYYYNPEDEQRHLNYLSEAQLYNDMNELESKIIHFGE